jgi:hypothetical protein
VRIRGVRIRGVRIRGVRMRGVGIRGGGIRGVRIRGVRMYATCRTCVADVRLNRRLQIGHVLHVRLAMAGIDLLFALLDARELTDVVGHLVEQPGAELPVELGLRPRKHRLELAHRAVLLVHPNEELPEGAVACGERRTLAFESRTRAFEGRQADARSSP